MGLDHYGESNPRIHIKTGANGFLLTRVEDVTSILPEGNLQGYQLQCLALLDLLTAAMMDVPHQ